MTNKHEDVFPVITLKYRKGDLIIKEGDYGISIYKIIKGEVSIFQESGDIEITLSTLGPGQIFGEISFLNMAGEIRSASVRAIENTVLEVWHPSILSKEYEEIPPMLKYVVDQISARLLRMNKLIVHLMTQEQKRQKAINKHEPLASRRRYYRKDVDLKCYYRPAALSPKVRLPGRIRDMSLNGLKLEIAAKNTKTFPHLDGGPFVVNTVLPNGKSIELAAKIVILIKSETPGKLLMGMSITELPAVAKKLLGFFLMP